MPSISMGRSATAAARAGSAGVAATAAGLSVTAGMSKLKSAPRSEPGMAAASAW